MKTIATVICCGDLVRHLYSTMASVERQAGGRGEIALVTDESTPISASEWLVELARARNIAIVNASTTRPGAIRNAGVRATQSPYVMCMDAGDVLDPHFHEAALEILGRSQHTDIITSSVQLIGPGSTRRTVRPEGVDLDALRGNTDVIHSASIFRRKTWVSVDGFDESLPALEAYDFWLRVLAAGGRCELIDRPLLIRLLRQTGMYRRRWERERHIGALEQILEKHESVFSANAADALYRRELTLQSLGDEYRHALGRRDWAVQELEKLKARAAELARALPEPERSRVDLGDLSRTTPIARDWGFARGRPIDRHYIERFLQRCAADIRGKVLEIQEADYAHQFGAGRVEQADVLDVDPSNPRATVISDLRSASNIKTDTYDCVILTQTLQLIDDMRSVVSECARILKPGGVLLATLPTASGLCLEYDLHGDFWRLTEAGARKLFAEIFPSDAVDVEAHGNVLVSAAFLYGLACHELTTADFDAVDPYFPLLITVRARKPSSTADQKVRPAPAARVAARRQMSRSSDNQKAAVLLYHRVGSPPSDVHGLSVPLQEFRAQMEHLRDHYHPMPLGDLVAAVRTGEVPAGAIAVTFDDGYVDNYTDASPILSSLAVPATFFVTTDRLNGHYEYWWDALERALLSPATHSAPTLTIDLSDGRREFVTSTRAQRMAAHTQIYNAIVGSPADVRDAVVKAALDWAHQSTPLAAISRRMRADEIVSLATRPGHTIGAHSAKHLMLPRQPPRVQRDEIETSRCTLEALLGRPVRTFAYPFGACNEDSAEAVRAGRFEIAVTTENSPLSRATDPLRVPRLEVTPERSREFANWLASRLKGE